MTAKTSPEKISECRRLRVECRLSIDEISAQTGIPKGTLYPFLKDLPLTDAELAIRRAAATAKGSKVLSEAAASRRGARSPWADIIDRRVKTTDQKGAIAEAAVIFRMKVWGFVPHIPMCAGGKSDVVVFVPDTMRVLRVQVKCARWGKDGMPIASLRSRSGGKIDVRYTEDAFDFFAGYDMREDVCYVFSMADIANRSSCVSMNRSHAERWDKLLVP